MACLLPVFIYEYENFKKNILTKCTPTTGRFVKFTETIPRIFGAAEWQCLELGLKQWVRALNA